MNVVISDRKTGKAYSKKIDDPAIFMNKKIGEEIDLSPIGLIGYSGKITGGSDKDGFPMKHDLQGGMRKKVFIFKKRKEGLRRRVTMRGNVIGKDINQLNIAVVKEGEKKLDELIKKVEKKEETISEQEKAIKEAEVIKDEGPAGMNKGEKRK